MTPEERAELKAMAQICTELSPWRKKGVLADGEFRKRASSGEYANVHDELQMEEQAVIAELLGVFPALLADLEETEDRYECNTAIMHARTARMNELTEELAATRKQLAEAQALNISAAEMLSSGFRCESSAFDCPPEPVSQWDYEAGLMVFALHQQDTSALQSAIAEAVEPYKRDAERYRWLLADHTTKEVRLKVYDIASSMDIRGKRATDAAIDAALDAKGCGQ